MMLQELNRVSDRVAIRFHHHVKRIAFYSIAA
jgi:hypothetical protein